jgi:hypothetical protein
MSLSGSGSKLMKRKGNSAMAEETNLPGSHPTEEKITHMKDFLSHLKDEANKAFNEKDAWSLGVYKELVKMVSPVISRAESQLDRESKARINKAHKALRKAEQEAKDKQKAEREAKEQKQKAG